MWARVGKVNGPLRGPQHLAIDSKLDSCFPHQKEADVQCQRVLVNLVEHLRCVAENQQLWLPALAIYFDVDVATPIGFMISHTWFPVWLCCEF